MKKKTKLFSFLICPLVLAAGPGWSAESVGIVDFGAKLGSGLYRGDYVQNSYPVHIDRDNNGTLTNDFVSCWYYSDTVPMNPDGLDYDTNSLSGVFYGGQTLYTISDVGRRGLSEGHINQNHEFRDDFNLMTLPAPRTGELLEAYAVYYWPKEGFLNGGADNIVTFDTNSRIAVHISRYWGGVNAGRWLVRDGDQFYLSENTFAGETQQFDTDNTNANTVVRRSHTVNPTETRWAPYTPVPNPAYPYEIDFDASSATFADYTFTNVTAIGFFLERYLTPPHRAASALTAGEPIAVKWNAVRAEAVVNSPAAPARNLNMGELNGTWLASNSVPYELWRKIFRFGVRRQFVDGMGLGTYSLEKDGSMGMMRADGLAHSGLEPVTDITWLDAVTWCNALSEFEGLEPCYYTDPTFTNVLRVIIQRDSIETWNNRPTIYWNTNSTGFRLPTAAEWAQQTAGMQNTSFWEYVWFPSGTVANPSVQTSRTALAWGLTEPTESILQFSEHPWNGSPRITFRPARNGSASPLFGTAGSAAAWNFSADTVLPTVDTLSAYETRVVVTQLLNEVTLNAGLANSSHIADLGFNPFETITTAVYSVEFGATEIPYSLWNFVQQWATDNGYEFNYSGDMGSMGNHPDGTLFSQNEPVTEISYYDALVWCNALSEIMGRRPVYYKDAALTNVWRQANKFRLESCLRAGYPNWPGEYLTPYDTASYIPVYMDITATGYRMPLPQEWNLANTTDTNSKTDAYNWLDFNAGGKTHPVATKLPNPVGLYDMEGNVRELSWGDTRANISRVMNHMGSHFARGYQKSHPTLDNVELPSVGRANVGFRTTRLTAPDPLYEGVEVSSTALTVTEGAVNTFTVHLSDPPSAAITVEVARVSGDADISVQSGSALIFTPSDWNVDQDVYVAAAEDADGDNGTAQIRCSADGINPAFVTVTEQDNDAQFIFSTNAITVVEGSTAQIKFQLSTEPAVAVTALVQRTSGDSSLSVAGSSIFVFGSGNWDVPQTIVIAAAEDADQDNGTAQFTCSAPNAIPAGFTATEEDNDFVVIASGLLAAWDLQSVPASPVATSMNAYFLTTGLVQSATGGVLTHSYLNRMVGRANALGATFTAGYASLDAALTAGYYFKWTLEPEEGCTITITNVSIVTEHDYSGVTGVLLSDASGLTSSDGLGTMPGGSLQHSSFNTSGRIENVAGPVQFRLYGFGDNSQYHTFVIGDMYSTKVENDIAIYGIITRTGGGGNGDTDSDGIPDEWETTYFGGATNANPSAMAANGINSVYETYIAGLDPTDPAAKLLINGSNPLLWTAASGRVYTVYWASNLLSGFQTLGSNLTAGAFTDLVHGTEQQGFYRVDVELAP